MKTLRVGGKRTRHRWILYIGYVGKWGDRLRLVRLDTRTRTVDRGWTIWKGPRP